MQDARTWAGVSVISMSFGSSEGNGETAYDTYFTTPPGHTGITFLAATGDDGAPGEYPAYSPNVLAVGGTTLSTDANGDYLGEAAWAWNSSYSWAGGGGHSTQESLPSFQDPNGVALKYYATPNDLSLSSRGTPDVSFDADPLTGVAVRDSYDYGSSTPWEQVGGTSLATPCWAGLIAIADQLRAAQNVPLLNSSSAHSLLYSIYESSAEYAAAFHDVSGGNNGPNNSGFSAGTGYDLATGIGSPVANVLVPALVSTTLYSANMNSNPGWTFTSGGQWAWGPPSGSGGEPSSGYTGSNVVGYNLAGDYGKLTTTYWATTPAINCTGDTAVTLDFWRWLGRREIQQRPRLHRGFQQRVYLDHRLAEPQQQHGGHGLDGRELRYFGRGQQSAHGLHPVGPGNDGHVGHLLRLEYRQRHRHGAAPGHHSADRHQRDAQRGNRYGRQRGNVRLRADGSLQRGDEHGRGADDFLPGAKPRRHVELRQRD